MKILIIGFVMGFLLPFIASRFGKVLPATPGAVIVNLYHTPRFPKVHNPIQMQRLRKKWYFLLMIALGWGIVMSLLFATISTHMPVAIRDFAYLFTWIVLICVAIDTEIQLLPDFFTTPLTLLGFLFAKQTGIIDISYSLAGAFFGYMISIVSVVATGASEKAEFGAGDAKFLTALGAWLGIVGLNYSIILSFFLFVLLSAVRGKKVGAYGPALGLAALFAFFAIYTK